MKYCNQCGVKLSASGQFCTSCGTAVKDTTDTTQFTAETNCTDLHGKQSFAPKVIIIFLVIIAVTLGGVWGILGKQKSKADTGNQQNSVQKYAEEMGSDTDSKKQPQATGSQVQPNNVTTGNLEKTKTSIVAAAALGDLQTVQELLDQGKDPNVSEYVDDLGLCTALMASAAKGQIETARLLIKRGADKNAFNMQGYDAMAYAVENNDLDMTNLLLRSGANSDRALGIATVNGDLGMVKMLLSAGADPNNVAARHQEAPLHLAASLANGSDIIVNLIQSGANVNQTDMYGETPLFIAVEENILANVRVLLENNADANIKNTSGETPLRKAKTPEMISLLQSYEVVQ